LIDAARHTGPYFQTMTTMRPISEMPAETARGIRWILTDIDDTMTKDGKLVSEAYAALCALSEAGLPVIALTGRSAGWGSVHLQEWPIAGAITENGAVSFHASGERVFPGAAPKEDPRIQASAEAAYRAVPRARPASDNGLRRCDYAIDHAERVTPPLTEAEIAQITGIFEAAGCQAKPSSIHVNCWIGDFNKRDATIRFLSEYEGYDDARDRSAVLYVGDAPNDEPMFGHFPNACAVANVDRWLDRIEKRPSWVAAAEYGAGFAEIAGTLLTLRGRPGRD